MIEFNQLEQLVTIANVGTISKAAEVLMISQPALTRSIQKLESNLGLTLFDRKKNKVTLNENGLQAVIHSQKLLSQRDKMISQLQAFDYSRHNIAIGSLAPAPIWGLNFIFNKLYPEMKITDTISSDENELLQGLADDLYSIIVLAKPFKHDDFLCDYFVDENLYLSLPPAHPLALGKEVTFNNLNGQSVLLLSRIGFWNEVCLKCIPDSHLLIQDDETVYNEIAKASALPTFRTDITIARNKEKENRIYLPISDDEAHQEYYLVYKKSNQKIFAAIQAEVNNIDWKNT